MKPIAQILEIPAQEQAPAGYGTRPLLLLGLWVINLALFLYYFASLGWAN